MAPRLLRRSLAALAVALLTFLAAGGILGVASADDGTAVPEAFGVPAPQAGDAWSYVAVLDEGWDVQAGDSVELGKPIPLASFRRADDPDTVRAGDRALHQTNRVDVASLSYYPYHLPEGFPDDMRRSWGEVPGSAHFTPSGLLMRNETMAWGASARSSGLVDSGAEARANATFSHFKARLEPCFVHNAFQGRELSLEAPLAVLPPCSLGRHFLVLPEPLSFRALGLESLDGRPVLHMASEGPGPQVDLWFSADVPVPVRIAFSDASPEVDGIGGGSAVLWLSSFEAGGHGLADDDLADRDVAPAPEPAKPQPWGPDDAGVDMAFPLSAAWDRARAAPAWPDLRDFLAREPDAYTGYASFMEVPDTATTHRNWLVVVVGGASSLAFSVRQEAPILPDALAAAEGLVATYAYETHDWDFGDWLAPLDQAPQEWPTIASTLATWERYAPQGDQAKPKGYTFYAACLHADDGKAPCQVAPVLMVGNTLSASASAGAIPALPVPVPGATGVRVTDGSLLVLDGAEVASYLAVRAEAVTTYTSVAGIPVTPPPPVPVAGDAGPETSPVLAGVLALGPTEAAGAWLLALLSAVAYWLWPMAKGGALGLFSRVEGDRLLEHPVRADLMARIEAEPGVHFQQLRRAASVGNGGLQHHLDKLEAAGLVRAVRTAGYTCYFARGARGGERAAPALKSDGARRVLDAVRRQPGMTGTELAQATGLSPATVSEHVARLAGAGLVQPLREGRAVRVQPLRA